MYGIKEKDVIRVKVKYCDDEKDPQIKKFAIDPRLTNYDVLIGLLVKGLNIKRDFVIHYLATDDFGEQFYLPLLSDWDLDAAILTASDPILRLKVNLKHKEKDLDEWDIVVPGEAPVKLSRSNLTSKSLSNLFKSINVSESNSRLDKSSSNSLFGQFYQQMEKTMFSFQRVFSNGKINEMSKPSKAPMSDIEFRNYMDNIGRIIQPDDFRRSVYLGGLEPSLRKVGWRLLLDVYPVGLTGRERLALLERKTREYRGLKHAWKQRFKDGRLTESEMAQIALVSVDVIRTDRSLNFYSGEKNQQHVAQLFDILALYCIYHPSVGYYQGMSDMASPLLFVQDEEAVAYLCFCSLMKRLGPNFTHYQQQSQQQSSIQTKLVHLHELLHHLDPQLTEFLHQKKLSDLYFAHRWLLLELKREFTFSDALRVLEVQWASLPHKEQGAIMSEGVPLVEQSLLCQGRSSTQSGSGSGRVRCYAVRDMSLVHSLVGPQYTPSPLAFSTAPRLSTSSSCCRSRSDSQEMTPPSAAAIAAQNHLLLETSFSAFTNSNGGTTNNNGPTPPQPSESSTTVGGAGEKLWHGCSFSDYEDDDDALETGVESGGDDTGINGSGVRRRRVHLGNEVTPDGILPEYKSAEDSSSLSPLPPPEELGLGNPLLLFLCVSLLQEYRELILTRVQEASDVLLLFQKLSQRHNLASVLARARGHYERYLRDHEVRRRGLGEFPELQLSM